MISIAENHILYLLFFGTKFFKDHFPKMSKIIRNCEILDCFNTPKLPQNSRTTKQHSLCQNSAQNINQIWQFLDIFGHYLPSQSSMFSHLEHVPAIISSCGYLYTLDSIFIITEGRIVEPFVNRKTKNHALLTIRWFQNSELPQI